MPLFLLRQAIIQQLQASKALQAKVQTESHGSIALQALPLVTVSLNKANSLLDWTALDAQGRLLEMIEQPILIKVTATGGQSLETTLEQMAVIINQTLIKDEKLGGLIKTLYLEEEADITISTEGEQPIGVLTQRWLVLYRRVSSCFGEYCN